MKKKNPWVAAILNFIFPGIGFAYLGSAVLFVFGIALFISNLVIQIIYYQHTVGMADRPVFWVFSGVAELSLAVITFVLTQIRNKSIEVVTEISEKKSL
jgi:hypothetical protein